MQSYGLVFLYFLLQNWNIDTKRKDVCVKKQADTE